MARKCSITRATPARGSRINRSGKAKKKGGIGMHVTSNTPRFFYPNLRNKRVWVPELKKFVRVKVSARALKSLNAGNAFQVLKEAGAI
ncbi:MAG: 50S ribosomal protein L28 [Candidatus Methylacidiphilales bacterium]